MQSFSVVNKRKSLTRRSQAELHFSLNILVQPIALRDTNNSFRIFWHLDNSNYRLFLIPTVIMAPQPCDGLVMQLWPESASEGMMQPPYLVHRQRIEQRPAAKSRNLSEA